MASNTFTHKVDYILSYFFFQLNTLKGTAKAATVDHMRLNTLA